MRVREGSYTTQKNGEPVTVHFTDGDTMRDVADLIAVVQGEYKGSPSTESNALQSMLGELQQGAPLSGAEWEELRRIRAKYERQLAAFRAGPDNETQGFVPLSHVGSGRIAEAVRLPPGLAARLRETGTPSTTEKDKAGTGPHLFDSVLHDLAHTKQHVARLLDPDVKADPKSIQFNAEHALNHVESAQDHAHRMDQHVGEFGVDPKTWSVERKALNGMREAGRALEEQMIANTVALFRLREGSPKPPPNLRVADPYDASSGKPQQRCSTCEQYYFGQCTGYNNLEVQPYWVCNSWDLDPSWQATTADGLNAPDLVGMALARREDSGKYMGGSQVYDPLLLKADTEHAAEAADRLLQDGRIRVQGQGPASQSAAASIARRVGDRAVVRTMAVQGTPYTHLTAAREAATWGERLAILREAVPAKPDVTKEPVVADPGQPDQAAHKPTLAIDFDGVLHMGGHGMPGEVEGMVVPGSQEALKALSERYKLVVLTARQDFAAVRRWLDQNGLGQYIDLVTNVKPNALAYIDDRAIHFAGDWPAAVAAASPEKATVQPIKVQRTYESRTINRMCEDYSPDDSSPEPGSAA